MKTFKSLLSLFSLCFIFNNCFAADIIFIPLNTKKAYIKISGTIYPEDYNTFITTLKKNKKTHRISHVILDSPGGHVIPSLEIANYIEHDGLTTVVARDNICASSCFLIFMSGRKRIAQSGASIFVHRISVEDEDNLTARGLSIGMNDIYKRLAVPDNIRLAMLDTPPNQAYQLTDNDLLNISTENSHSDYDDLRKYVLLRFDTETRNLYLDNMFEHNTIIAKVHISDKSLVETDVIFDTPIEIPNHSEYYLGVVEAVSGEFSITVDFEFKAD